MKSKHHQQEQAVNSFNPGVSRLSSKASGIQERVRLDKLKVPGSLKLRVPFTHSALDCSERLTDICVKFVMRIDDLKQNKTSQTKNKMLLLSNFSFSVYVHLWNLVQKLKTHNTEEVRHSLGPAGATPGTAGWRKLGFAYLFHKSKIGHFDSRQARDTLKVTHTHPSQMFVLHAWSLVSAAI